MRHLHAHTFSLSFFYVIYFASFVRRFDGLDAEEAAASRAA